MSTFANTNKMSSSHRTSNNYYDNQKDDLMDTDDVPSSEQSDEYPWYQKLLPTLKLPVPKMTATMIPVLLIIVY